MEKELEETQNVPKNKIALIRSSITLGALGVVFGDIGTSPLYALRECFSGPHAIPITHSGVFGTVSLIFWFLIVIVSVKYVLFVMRADNKGEGGILALIALIHRLTANRRKKMVILSLLGMLGVALLISDGVLTPAISVLSAMEGLSTASPMFNYLVIPFSLLILTGLFVIQSKGTHKIGALFGPLLFSWFVIIAILGITAIFKYPAILNALNPWYAISLLHTQGIKSISLLSTAFLSVTGAEVLYADMGHFGKKPIHNAWFFIVFPSLILNYLGQGAILMIGNGNASNLFYQIAPKWFIYPLVAISTIATIIASQAVISGAFSLVRQAVQLGFWPRTRIIHTSIQNIGQVYIPFINGMLFVVTFFLIASFKHSSNLASAYGITVSITMFITTILVLLISRSLMKIPYYLLIPFGGFLVLMDASLVIANLSKLLAGGWMVILFAVFICMLMSTWTAGRRILQQRIQADSLPINNFVEDISKQKIIRIPKTAIFLSGNVSFVPRALLHNYKHNGILHENTVIISVITEETPFISHKERCTLSNLGQGIYTMIFRYGFMESPDIPKALEISGMENLPKNPLQLSFFLGKESLVISGSSHMQTWRKQLFLFLTRNALNASAFFKLPPNRVIELGVQIEF